MDCDTYRDQMLDVLYGEAGDPARRAVEAHHAACADCRGEMAAFRRLRRDLSSWSVPAAARPRRALRVWPGLAAAAAALLALGTAVSWAGAELRRDERGWSLSVGRPSSTLQARLDEQDARHRAEIQQLRAALVAPPPAADARALLAEAQALVDRSERRQDVRLQEAIAGMTEHYEAQRRYDLAQMSAGLSYLEGKAGLHAARNTELVGKVLLASQEK